MNLMDRKWLAWAIIVALIVLSTITGINFPIPPSPEDPAIQAAGYTHLSGLVVAGPTTVATATPAAIFNSNGLGALLEIQDGATPVARFNDGAGLTLVDGDMVIADDLVITAQTAISVTMNGYVTPTGTYQPIESFGNVSTTNLAILPAGTVVNLINTVNTTITFTDTGVIMLTGNASLGQYDTLTMWSDGTNWVEVAQANN